MRKLILFAFLVCSSLLVVSQENSGIPEKKEQSGFFQLDFLSVNMPKDPAVLNEPNMGLAGIHYNLTFKDFYTGLGIYGSVSGKRGGLFTLGFNAGYKKYLSERFFMDTGFHFGGGGGAGAADGGGAFILPHFNLGYQFDKFSLSTGYSYINFFDGGRIRGSQLNFSLQVPLSFGYASYKAAETVAQLDRIKNSKWNKAGAKISLMLHLNNLSVKGSSQDTNGLPLGGETIRLAGFEINSYVSDSWFLLIKADGAYDGIPAGYMDILLGGGYHFSFNRDRTNILTKFAVGAGGGGGVDTQGGVLIYPDISLEQHISSNVYVSINKGLLMSPNSFFRSSTFGVGLKYYTRINGVVDANDSTYKFKGFEVVLKQDMYLNADRDLAPTEHMHQISMQLNFNLTKNMYLAGQTSFANFGNAGAYAEGIVGIGFKTNPFLNEKVSLFGQVLTGAAGGGQISTGEGLIIKPSMGANWFLNDQLSLKSALGYVKARGGNLSSPFLSFGIGYRFSFLSSN